MRSASLWPNSYRPTFAHHAIAHTLHQAPRQPSSPRWKRRRIGAGLAHNEVISGTASHLQHLHKTGIRIACLSG